MESIACLTILEYSRLNIRLVYPQFRTPIVVASKDSRYMPSSCHLVDATTAMSRAAMHGVARIRLLPKRAWISGSRKTNFASR